MEPESKSKPEQDIPFSNLQLKTDELPHWEAVVYEPLASAAPWESFFHSCIVFSIMLVFVLGTLLIPGFPGSFSAVLLALVPLLFALEQWHNFAEHKVRGVAVREKDILFQKGLFWRQRSVLPFNRVQHIETHRNPIERKLGLSSLKLFTAGGSGVDLQIKGLENLRADKIKQYILERAQVEGVENGSPAS